MQGLGGIQLSGASLQQYNNLLMSNFTNINPALQLSSHPNQMSYPGTSPSTGQPASCYPGFQVTPSQLPLLSTSDIHNEPITPQKFQAGESQMQKKEAETSPNISPVKSLSPCATSPVSCDHQTSVQSN